MEKIFKMTIEKFKEVLGETATKMSEDEILKLMTVFDYLSTYWLEQQERKIFGCTAKELLDRL